MTTTRPVDNRCFDRTQATTAYAHPGSGRIALSIGEKRTDCSFDRESSGTAYGIGTRRSALSIGGRTECSFDWGERTDCSFDWGSLLSGAGVLRLAGWSDGRRSTTSPRPRVSRRRRCRGRSPGPAGSTPRRRRGSSPPPRRSATARAPLPGPRPEPARRTLALVVTDITNPFYGEIIRGRPRGGRRVGYTAPALAHPGGRASSSASGPSASCAPSRASCSTSSRMSDPAIRMIAKQKPVVVLNRRLPEVPCIVTDNARGVRRAVEHLAELGHDSITYVAGPGGELGRRHALAGAARGGARAGAPGPPGRPVQHPDRRRPASRRAREIAAQRADGGASPTTTSWPSASSRACTRLGLRVPGRRQRRRLRQHRCSPRSSSRG